ncbi:MAG: DUF2818 family protein [Candidatus Eutrophobiaceae bacterium]
MTLSTLTYLYLLIAVVLANVPWVSKRVFGIWGFSRCKPVWLRLLEWLCLGVLVGALGRLFERNATGDVHAQDWEFYAVNFFLFAVFAFPGSVWRYGRHWGSER